MHTLKNITTTLIMTLLLSFTGFASATIDVNLKTASGVENLAVGGYQQKTVFKLLFHQGKIDFSYDDASGSPVATKNTGRLGKQKRLRDLANDDKASSADRGWIKNEIRHIKNKNRKTIRLPRNSRKSRQGGSVLAHKRGKRAKDGHGYDQSVLQDTDLHKLEHKHGGY